MSSTVWLLLWVVAAVSLQRLTHLPLILAAGVFMAVAWRIDGARLYRLLRRSRWLLLAMAILFGWMTPGIYLLPDLGALSPSREGLLQGIEHATRLLGLVAMVSVLLSRWTPTQLVDALARLMAPLHDVGRRAALRLALVLDYVEQVPPAHQWRQWLASDATTLPSVFPGLAGVAHASRADALLLLWPVLLLWLA